MDLAGAGQAGQEQALAAEQDVAEARHHLDVERDGGFMHAHMAGGHQDNGAGSRIGGIATAGVVGGILGGLLGGDS